MKPKFFTTQDKVRTWLEENHEQKTELLVGFYKVATGKPSMTWSESVDQALCFGWIDGIRRRIDEESYSIRFTPRNPKSIWSAVNIAKVADLTGKGLMKPTGIAAFGKRDEKRSRIYAYERKNPEFSSGIEKEFQTNKLAWKFFGDQPPSYRKTITHWVMSAKQERTRVRRLEKLVEACEKGERL